MANSISAEVWLDERRWDALEVVLEEQGSNIEQHLQEYLLDLYREMVPPDQVREIESDIQKEALETQREREARKVFSAFRLCQEFILTDTEADIRRIIDLLASDEFPRDLTVLSVLCRSDFIRADTCKDLLAHIAELSEEISFFL